MILILAILLLLFIVITTPTRKSTPELYSEYKNNSNYYKSSWQRLGRWKLIRKNKK